MKGGSVASNSVTKLVSEPTYAALTKNFSPFTATAKCGGKPKPKPKPKPKAKAMPKAKKGGNPFSTVSEAVTKVLSSAFNTNRSVSEGFNVFRSSPAPAGYQGGKFENMSKYTNTGTYNVKNRKGGSLNYSAITNSMKLNGDAFSRTTPDAVNRLMASDPIATTIPLNKTATFGSVLDKAHYFSYSGVNDKIVNGGKCKRSNKTKRCSKST